MSSARRSRSLGDRSRQWTFTLQTSYGYDPSTGFCCLDPAAAVDSPHVLPFPFLAPLLPASAFSYLIYQLEVAPSTSRVHYQGYVELPKRTAFNAVKALFLVEGLSPSIEKAVAPAKAIAYCRKQDSVLCLPGGLTFRFEEGKPIRSGVSTDFDRAVALIKGGGSIEEAAVQFSSVFVRHGKGLRDLHSTLAMRGSIPPPAPPTQWYPWQQEMIDMLSESPHSRRISWVCDPVGSHGKTVLAKFLMQSADTVVVRQCTDYKRVAHMVATRAFPRVVVFDFSRTETTDSAVSYSCMENIKDGFITSTMYTPVTVSAAPPHVVVLTNVHPKLDKLTHDRWDIWTEISCTARPLRQTYLEYFAAMPRIAGDSGHMWRSADYSVDPSL